MLSDEQLARVVMFLNDTITDPYEMQDIKDFAEEVLELVNE